MVAIIIEYFWVNIIILLVVLQIFETRFFYPLKFVVVSQEKSDQVVCNKNYFFRCTNVRFC